jgi:RNA polymerase sigma-70 factor, ECF subfamily
VEFDRLYEQNVSQMIGQVTLLTSDLGAAQDAVQEAWVKAWLRWDKIGAYDNPVAWVRRVAMNTAVSRWRRTRRLVSSSGSSGSDGSGRSTDTAPAVLQQDVGQLVDLQRALARLPAAARRVVVLHYLVGLSVDEIAAELGIPSGTVKSRLSRARDSLATNLQYDEEHHHV